MPAPKFDAVKAEYGRLWSSMTINPGRVASFKKIANRLMKGMPRYRNVEAATGVPAVMIAILHLRESDADFDTYLGNGQSLFNKKDPTGKGRTTIVPKGRGPFRNFEEGAVDALAIDGLSAIKNWSIEMMLFKAEAFNGFGYRGKGIRSPYLWGGTNHQQKGKYVRDKVFDPSVMDTQPGAAAILYQLFAADPSLRVRMLSGPPPAFPKTEPPKPGDGLMEPEPAADKPGKKAAPLGLGGVFVMGLAYFAENPWLAVVGLVALGAIAVLVLRKKG